MNPAVYRAQSATGTVARCCAALSRPSFLPKHHVVGRSTCLSQLPSQTRSVASLPQTQRMHVRHRSLYLPTSRRPHQSQTQIPTRPLSTTTTHRNRHTTAAMSTATDQAALIEQSKKLAAYQAVKEHLDAGHRHVGIGSGSTVVYVVEAIAALGADITGPMTFYPTGDQSRGLIEDAGLCLATISQLPLGTRLDVCFDGADEVDDQLNLIKGGGACLFQEKIVATAATKFVCVADYRKLSPSLGTAWKQGIPIEVLPLAAKRVLSELTLLGAQNPRIRQGLPAKAGPVVTDNSMWLIDAPFAPLQPTLAAGRVDGTDGVWSVDGLADRLIKIPGIVETGLFAGFNGFEAKDGLGGAQKPVAAYFGMADGTVQVRSA